MSIALRKGLPSRVPVTISTSSPVGVTPPAAASMSLTRTLLVSSGKRPGFCTWPSTDTWLPRTCSSTMLTCGAFRIVLSISVPWRCLLGLGDAEAAQRTFPTRGYLMRVAAGPVVRAPRLPAAGRRRRLAAGPGRVFAAGRFVAGPGRVVVAGRVGLVVRSRRLLAAAGRRGIAGRRRLVARAGRRGITGGRRLVGRAGRVSGAAGRLRVVGSAGRVLAAAGRGGSPAASASSPAPAESSPPPAAAAPPVPAESSPPHASPAPSAAASPPLVVAVPPAGGSSPAPVGPPPLPSGSMPGPAGPPRPNLTMMQPMRVPSAAPSFVDAGAIRAAAEAAGLRLPDGVYANVAAALNAGKHLLLTGRPGAGKTWLALAVTRAAAQAGKARGATVVTGAPKPELVVDAASRGRWVIVDELDQADPDEVLSSLSAPRRRPGHARQRGGRARRRLATDRDLERRAAAGRNPQALRARRGPAPRAGRSQAAAAAGRERRSGRRRRCRAARRDRPRDRRPAGRRSPCPARNAAAPADEPTLAREVFDAYAAPLQDR